MLAQEIVKGDVKAAARLIRGIEEAEPWAFAEIDALIPHTGKAHVVGITGPPGSGKSSLVDRLIEAARAEGRTVGVIVIDPTSPYTGGALLGDRVRMQRHTSDPGVFIRSLASRGTLGGLAPFTRDMVAVLDAMGKQLILVETVGTGQDGVRIAELAHTTVVVTLPGTGDGVQLAKAGILEAGDIFAVNKADLPGADTLVCELKAMVDMRPAGHDAWIPPVVATAPLTGMGTLALLEQIDRHRAGLVDPQHRTPGRDILERRFFEALRDRLFHETRDLLTRQERWAPILEAVGQGRMDVDRAVAAAVSAVFHPDPT